jgi:PAS domain S-box-containing protein
MEERQACVLRELDGIFREWSARTAFLGAAIFLLLSPLDFYAVPAHAARFLAYRLAVAALLAASGAFLRRPRSRAATQGTAFLCVLASAAVLEAMILDFGGHHSPYLAGLILVAVTVLGLIPAGPVLASLFAGTIFAVYLGPILVLDTFHESGFFGVETLLFAAILATSVLINWLHRRHLVHEVSLRHHLTWSRERLEEEAARRAQANVELRESQALLSSIATAAIDAIVMIDPEGTIRYWNTAAERIFGHPAAAAVGRGAFALLADPAKADELLADHRAWLAAGEGRLHGRRIVTRGRRGNGETFPMELALSAVEREGVLWTCALLRDITEQARGEERLRLYAAAVEAAVDAIFILDLEGRVVFCNSAGAAQLGRVPAEIMGQDIRRMYLDPGIYDGTIVPGLRRTGHWSGEFAGTDRSGKPVMVWLSASLIRDADGRAMAMVGITKDLTEQRRLEEERIKIQKLESIGVLAGGLAHDFNNLLTIILGNLDLARLFAGANPEAAEALDHASEAALRAGDLTRQLITFSKGGQPVKRVGSIARTVRETVAFAAAGSNISCAYDLPDDLPAIEFDEGQIRQVIHNLVQNAREAMPGGGTLQVSARALRLGEGEILGLPAGRYVCLQFRDCGGGIDRAHLSRIFDPYFSTKEMDTVKGRGLGLAVSFSIVRSHGGTMMAQSTLAEGTTVSVYLPESTRSPEAVDPGEGGEPGGAEQGVARADRLEPEPERSPEGTAKARVLVMDDEPLVLGMAGAVLRRLGYAATLARSGAEAVVQYQIALDAGRRFDAVILDLTVPGGPGGPETLARLREIDPAVQAALSSGHIDHPAVTDWAGAGFAAFIAKPYSIKAFEEALARLL